MRKLRTALLAATLAASALIAPIVAAPAAQAADVGLITIYHDHNDIGFLYNWGVTGGCANGRQIVAYILTYEIQRASSIRFLAGGLENQQCNYLSVRSHSDGWNYQRQCVRSVRDSFNFDAQHNDNSDAWVLSYNPACLWYFTA
jgi:hypothetical protein